MFYAACEDLEIRKWIVLEFNNEKEQKTFIAGRGGLQVAFSTGISFLKKLPLEYWQRKIGTQSNIMVTI